MLSVQEIGTEILTGSPKSFYVLGGSEYGVKQKYISILKDKFGTVTECPTMSSVISMLSQKHIVPLKPAVYLVRYDETFISELSDKVAKSVRGLKFVGTIVCLYEQANQLNKLEKYFPDNVAIVDKVSPQFLSQYLHSDFPKLPDRFIELAVMNASNYCQAQNICRAMSCASVEELYSLEDGQLLALFGLADTHSEMQIRLGIAARNFKYLIELTDDIDDVDSILYNILQTMIELDKLKDNKYTQSELRPYIKNWTREDIYYMFMNTYDELKKLRSAGAGDSKSILTYLFALLKYSRIPAPEVMNNWIS